MQIFDYKERCIILDDNVVGYNRHFISRPDSQSYGPNADAALTTAAYCAVVGYDGPARLLLEQARKWLAVAIAADEQTRDPFPRDLMRAERHFTLAWCNWLLDDFQDIENFTLAFDYRRRALPQTGPRRSAEFDLSIVDDLNAALWQQVIDDFALARITPAASPARVRREGQMALILARHALGLDHDEAAVAVARDTLLKRNVNSWLLNGHALYVVKWMKLFFWREGGPLSAFETVRKAYDYLPGVTPPEMAAR